MREVHGREAGWCGVIPTLRLGVVVSLSLPALVWPHAYVADDDGALTINAFGQQAKITCWAGRSR